MIKGKKDISQSDFCCRKMGQWVGWHPWKDLNDPDFLGTIDWRRCFSKDTFLPQQIAAHIARAPIFCYVAATSKLFGGIVVWGTQNPHLSSGMVQSLEKDWVMNFTNGMLQAYGKPQVNPAPLEIYIVFYSLMLLPIVLSQKQETRETNCPYNWGIHGLLCAWRSSCVTPWFLQLLLIGWLMTLDRLALVYV